MTPTMSNPNPIILIDDDADDTEIFMQGFKDLGIKNENNCLQ